jgi:hypothetical protein
MTDEDIFGTTPIVEEQVEATPAPEPEAPEPVAEPAPEPEATEPVTPVAEPAKPDPGFVPLAAVLDERDRRKQLEAEVARLNAQQQPQEPLDPWSDLEGTLTAQEQKFQAMLYQQQITMSDRFARQAYGDELVEKATKWGFERCAQDPYFNAQVIQSGDPVGYAVQQYQRDQIASKVDLTEFEKFQAWQAAQAQLTQQTAVPVAATPSPVQPPPSLASAPSAGSSTQPKPNPEEEKLNAMF